MKTEKRDQVLSMKVTKKVIEKINYITRSKNISRPDLFTSYVFAQNDNEQQRKILDSIAWESNLLQNKIQKLHEDLLHRINEDTDISLFDKSYEIILDQEKRKDITTYQKGDLLKTINNNLLIIKSINTQIKEISLLVIPITQDSSPVTVNLINDHSNIAKLFRY